MKIGVDRETGKWYRTWRRPFHLVFIPSIWVLGIVMASQIPWSTLEGIRLLGAIVASITMVGTPPWMFWEEWRLVEISPPPGPGYFDLDEDEVE